MWWTQGEFGQARTEVSRALTLVREAGDMGMVARAEDLSARVEHALGNVNAAHDHFARSIEGFQALGMLWGAGSALIGMTAVALATGDDGEAERLLDEATSVLRQAGPWFLARALVVRAIVAVRRGNPDEAIALVRDSLTQVRDLQDKWLFVYALVPLAAAAVLKDDDTWAARILGARDAVAEHTGYKMFVKLVHDLREQAEREARARLGPDRWAQAYAAGRRASIDALLKDIDSALGQGSSASPE